MCHFLFYSYKCAFYFPEVWLYYFNCVIALTRQVYK